jgi:AraC-like DNA-binding protein
MHCRTTGAWLSWLERRVHIAEIAGSIPAAPIFFLKDKESRGMIIIRTLSRMFFIFLVFSAAYSSLNATTIDSTCLAFECPAGGAVIQSAVCTLSVNACPNIESIRLSARYYPLKGNSDTVLDLGTIAQPPFKLIWNIAEVPNQLFKGMGFIANGTFKNGSHLIVRREGVFLYNKKFPPLSVAIPAAAVQPQLFWCDTLPFIKAPTILRAFGNWNAKELHFTVVVTDPFFSTAVPKDKLSLMGVDFFFDPLLTKEPHPSEKSMVIMYPLNKKPSRLLYKKNDDGKNPVGLIVDTVDCACPGSVKMVDGKGFRMDLDVPKALIAAEMPDSLGFNCIVKLLDREGQLMAVALNGATGAAASCPILWATLTRTRTDIFHTAAFILGASFGIGLFITLVSLPLFSRRRRSITMNVSDLSDEEKRRVQKTFGFIEQNVTQKNLSLHEAGRALSMSGAKIEKIINKFNGLSFKGFVMKSRVEIAKERLRCSHASETAIAESCGFGSVDEMEKCFSKYCRSTPYNYRRDNQVA